MSILVILIVIHPVLVTLCSVVFGLWLINRPAIAPYSRKIAVCAGIVLAVYFAGDSLLAYRRVQYISQLPDQPLIHQRIPAPRSLVFDGLSCDTSCRSKLVNRDLDEVIVLRGFDPADGTAPPSKAWRYAVQFALPNDCPADPDRFAEKFWTTATLKSFAERGICLTLEEVVPPTEGIFIVRAGRYQVARDRARLFSSPLLLENPPYRASVYFAVEVQRRIGGKSELIARTSYFEGPGYLGLPPLIGCWERPDNIIWIMPPGETGCGFWRLRTQGGDKTHPNKIDWIYAAVFTTPTDPQEPVAN